MRKLTDNTTLTDLLKDCLLWSETTEKLTYHSFFACGGWGHGLGTPFQCCEWSTRN